MAEQIGSLLNKTINKAGISEQVGAAVVCDQFNKIVIEVLGQNIKDKVKALYVKNKTLSVAALSSVVGQEIKLHEQEILEKLVVKVGKNKVERLRFLV